MLHTSCDRRQSVIGRALSISTQQLLQPLQQCINNSTSVCIPGTAAWPSMGQFDQLRLFCQHACWCQYKHTVLEVRISTTVAPTVAVTVACTVPMVALMITPCIHHVLFVFGAFHNAVKLGWGAYYMHELLALCLTGSSQ